MSDGYHAACIIPPLLKSTVINLYNSYEYYALESARHAIAGYADRSQSEWFILLAFATYRCNQTPTHSLEFEEQ